MRQLSIWDEIHDEIEKLKKLVEPKLANAIEAVVLTAYSNPGLTKKEIREESGVRKQRVSQVIKKLTAVGWLKSEGRGVKRDPLKYFATNDNSE